MALLILDASVVIKWFKDETHKEYALKIRENFYLGINEIAVPDLLLYEISNSMRYDSKFDEDSIKQSLESIISMDIDITIPTEELINDAVDTAYKYNITVYDAIYVSLAKLMNAIFITADEKLYEKIKDLEFVRFITSYE